MAERARRYAKRPKIFALLLVGTALLAAVAVAALAQEAKTPLYSVESGRSR
jgi:hypothetical protein